MSSVIERGAAGTACAENRECNSGYCVDAVCCDSACQGTCRGCSATVKGYGVDGVCDFVTANTDPRDDCPTNDPSTCALDGLCTNAGACKLYGSGTPCGETTCVGNSVKGEICDGIGSCVNETAGLDCSPYLCLENACTNPCEADADCASGFYCDAGTCREKDANGQTCTANNTCDSGFCVDGFCCDRSCTGQCEACDEAGSEGLCNPIDGDPHGSRTACQNAGLECGGACDGVNGSVCTYSASGTTCGQPTCADGFAESFECNGQGECISRQSVQCGGYACAETECKTSCTLNEDCANRFTCKDGICAAATAVCSPDLTQSIGNETESCEPYLCDPVTGTCRVACSVTSQCALGFVCDSAEKKCLSATDEGTSGSGSGDDGSCAVSSTGRRGSAAGFLLLGAIVLLAAHRRRRAA